MCREAGGSSLLRLVQPGVEVAQFAPGGGLGHHPLGLSQQTFYVPGGVVDPLIKFHLSGIMRVDQSNQAELHGIMTARCRAALRCGIPFASPWPEYIRKKWARVGYEISRNAFHVSNMVSPASPTTVPMTEPSNAG